MLNSYIISSNKTKTEMLLHCMPTCYATVRLAMHVSTLYSTYVHWVSSETWKSTLSH